MGRRGFSIGKGSWVARGFLGRGGVSLMGKGFIGRFWVVGECCSLRLQRVIHTFYFVPNVINICIYIFFRKGGVGGKYWQGNLRSDRR